MDSWIAFEILIISLLIVLSAFFSGSETALISVNKVRIRHLADSGNKNAAILIKLLENPEEFLTAILIGNNIVNISASGWISLLVSLTRKIFRKPLKK